MARPQVIGSVGVTLSGSAGVTADWSTGEYAYDGAGNITAMGGETYTYDKVSRLVSSSRHGGESYTFDAFGNLTAMNGLARTTDPATNRLTEAAYDRRGNLVGWGGYSFTWDTMGRMSSMQGPGINRSMFYDANGERLVVRDGTGYTFTLRDLGQEVLREVSWSSAAGWQWRKDYVYRDGVLLASQSTSAGEGLRYHVPDHLTSPRLLTNRCGERAVEHRASSFGVDVLGGSSQSADRMRFTMHERDLGQLSITLDDLDSMYARTYWPSLGRFLSVDPGRDNDARVPQSWNLYAYVRNNPLSRIDPNGAAAVLVVAVPPAMALHAAASAAIIAWLSAESSSQPGRTNAEVIAGHLDRFRASLFRRVGPQDQLRARDRGYRDHARARWARKEQRTARPPGPERPGGGGDLPPGAPGPHTRVGERPQDPLTPNELDLTRIGPTLAPLGAAGARGNNASAPQPSHDEKPVGEVHLVPLVMQDVPPNEPSQGRTP